MWSTTAPQSALSQLSFVASLAVHACASKLESPDAITLKWPNDCLLNGEKFCGILCEVIALDLVAIGIGINIAHVPDDLPYKVSKLTTATVESVFEILQSSLSNYLEIWQNGQGFSRIRQLWMAHCTHLGQTVRINALSGTFEGLASDGAMQLRLKDGSLKALYAGDMRLEYGNEI